MKVDTYKAVCIYFFVLRLKKCIFVLSKKISLMHHHLELPLYNAFWLKLPHLPAIGTILSEMFYERILKVCKMNYHLLHDWKQDIRSFSKEEAASDLKKLREWLPILESLGKIKIQNDFQNELSNQYKKLLDLIKEIEQDLDFAQFGMYNLTEEELRQENERVAKENMDRYYSKEEDKKWLEELHQLIQNDESR
jgi:hypothetical protein